MLLVLLIAFAILGIIYYFYTQNNKTSGSNELVETESTAKAEQPNILQTAMAAVKNTVSNITTVNYHSAVADTNSAITATNDTVYNTSTANTITNTSSTDAITNTSAANTTITASTTDAIVSCEVGAWSEWICADDVDRRTRQITRPGESCPPLEETKSCAPVPCVVSDWSPWTCDRTTNVGQKSRQRTVITPATNGGTCPALVETAPCDPIDCVMAEWSSWTCDPATAIKTRRRVATVAPEWGGAECPAFIERAPCDPINCTMTEWYTQDDWRCAAEWEPTPKRDLVVYNRDIIAPALYGGTCGATQERRSCPTGGTLYPNDVARFLDFSPIYGGYNTSIIEMSFFTGRPLRIYGVRFYRPKDVVAPWRRTATLSSGHWRYDNLQKIKSATVIGETVDTSRGNWIAVKFDAPVTIDPEIPYTVTVDNWAVRGMTDAAAVELNQIIAARAGNIWGMETRTLGYGGPLGIDIIAGEL